MKAYHVMAFLLLFNLSVSLIGAVHIYNMGVSVPEDFSQADISTYEGTTGRRNMFDNFLFAIIGGLLSGVVWGGIVSYFTKIPADKSFVYSVFVNEYIAMSWSATTVLWNIGGQYEGVIYLVIIFAIILCVILLAGLMQMPIGGWKAYD